MNDDSDFSFLLYQLKLSGLLSPEEFADLKFAMTGEREMLSQPEIRNDQEE